MSFPRRMNSTFNVENSMVRNIREVTKWEDCYQCDGRGVVEDLDGDGNGGEVTCPSCLGERGRMVTRLV